MDETGVIAMRGLLIEISRFFRFSVLGFSVLLPLIGAAAVSPTLSGTQLAALAAVGVAFHIFAYVSNDVFDLDVDRTQPLRAGSPLVRGVVGPRVALAIACVPVPLALFVHLRFGGAMTAATSLVAATVLMLAYNLWGKRLRFPLLSDAIQALGWVALAFYGVLGSEQPLTETAAWLAATIFVYVMLINGLHGGLRDLDNDARHGARTTALYFGAHWDAAGTLIVPRAFLRYGFVLEILLPLLQIACVLRAWPPAQRIHPLVMAVAISGSHRSLLSLGRKALRASNPKEMIRAGMMHLFLSIGVVCLPFAFFTNGFATAVIVAVYALPVLILALRLTMHARRIAAAMLFAVVLLPSPSANAQQTVVVIPRAEIVRAMTVQKNLGYNLCATANGARFNAGVIFYVARNRSDPERTPFVLAHDDYYAAFVDTAGCNAVPKFIQIAHDRREDQYVDYRGEKVISSIKGAAATFAVNVVAGWTGAPPSYAYEDLDSKPKLRVRHDRISSYRLIELGDMIFFDDIHGIYGRALDGVLGAIFAVIGDAQAVRSFVAFAADGTQVTCSTGHKAFITVSPFATVDLQGRGEKDVPKRHDLQALKKRIEKAANDIEIRYVAIQPEAALRWRRISAP